MSIWTKENVEQLRALRAQGLSSTKIANILQCSRNSVVGKLAREGIAPPTRHGVKQNRQSKLPPKPPVPFAMPFPQPLADSKPVVTTDLSAYRGCRYIVNDSWPALHCNREGFPWCEPHAKIIWRR